MRAVGGMFPPASYGVLGLRGSNQGVALGGGCGAAQHQQDWLVANAGGSATRRYQGGATGLGSSHEQRCVLPADDGEVKRWGRGKLPRRRRLGDLPWT